MAERKTVVGLLYNRATMAALMLAALLSVVACGKDPQNNFDGDGAFGAPPGSDIPSEEPGSGEAPDGEWSDLSKATRVVLTEATVLRFSKNDVLEVRAEVPAGTSIDIPKAYEIQNLRYRKVDGTIDWTSTGFIAPVAIVSVPSAHAGRFPPAVIAALNQTSGGLYVFASIVGNLQGVEGDFAAIKGGAAGADFTARFEASGKPKFNYTAAVQKRFADRLNKGVDPKKQTEATRIKWRRVYNELKRFADRSVPTAKALLMIDKDLAIQQSIAFEKNGTIPLNGAWTIAVLATAPRHGFPNVPCAEFMSEAVREAYQRAGYAVTDDFNAASKNRLFWSESAAVVNFSKALYVAGWVPWDASLYRPITGALMMHGSGQTPGHTYISGGHDGRIVVDNGSPQGRDLRVTVAKTIDLMFRTGVFFLPPGINPPKW